MSRISLADVERTAALAQLELSDGEIAALTRDLDRILEHAEALGRLDTTDIPPTAHAIPLETPLRDDDAVPGMDPELALSNAPLREGSAFVVPKVIENEET
jgi:aspartyl-tRNA(Asn)/glutamyl-tRNA(Gln) amidotransferase subunit C